jgi:acyl transferase domain-containing protein
MHLQVFHGCKLQADDAFANYEPKAAFLFPGQGAQTVGMAQVRTTV